MYIKNLHMYIYIYILDPEFPGGRLRRQPGRCQSHPFGRHVAAPVKMGPWRLDLRFSKIGNSLMTGVDCYGFMGFSSSLAAGLSHRPC